MSLIKADMKESARDLAMCGIEILECDICGVRFSTSMTGAWPFCSAGIPHEYMTAREQQRRQKLLAETPEKATASFVFPFMKLYGPTVEGIEEQSLPDMPNLEIVNLPKDRCKQFADYYKIQGMFIGNVLGKHNWSMNDLINYSMKAWPEQELPNDPTR